MTTQKNSREPFIYLAPLRGLTDALFRETFAEHFHGFNAAIAPFISPQKKALYGDKMIRDVLPENNTRLPVVPQLLHTDPEDFLVLANRLADLGYTHLNWNLGCPAPMVARKKRGSGLLPYTERILSLLDRVLPRLPTELSIKTRLGYHDSSEIKALLPQLNDLKIKEIIIHTRLGSQLYKGSTQPDGFELCQQLTGHTLTYNGDINDLATYRTLASRFPTVNRWMLGRGALGNPFLAEEIKGLCAQSKEERRTRLYMFHRELYDRYTRRLSGPSHLLGRLKHLWLYLNSSFPGEKRLLKKILKTGKPEQYLKLVDQLFEKSAK